MKTVLFIDASGACYYRRVGKLWLKIEHPEPRDRVWVIADQPEEMLEVFQLPLLLGADRRHFMERKLNTAFPHSDYRATALLSGKWWASRTAVLTGLNARDTVNNKLAHLASPLAGVWGISLLLTLLLQRLTIANVLLALPSTHYLRILAIKQGKPVLTRCVHRYNEEDNDANEILRTRQHLENQRITEHDAPLPVLYLGDPQAIRAALDRAGLTLLDVPARLAPQGDAAYRHSLFDFVTTHPRGQLAPLLLRAEHLTERIRSACYAGMIACALTALLLGQEDFRALIDLHGRENTLNEKLRLATQDSENLAGHIRATGIDPALLRQAVRFAARELDAPPSPHAIMQFTAAAIAELPQVRIKSLTFRFPQPGERYCQTHSVIDLPLVNRKFHLPLPDGGKPDDDESVSERYAELQFSILLTEELPQASQTELRRHISATLKHNPAVELMQDPAAFSLLNTLKGGMDLNNTQNENLWCMSVPWRALALANSAPPPQREAP